MTKLQNRRTGRVVRIGVSQGGVPKRAIDRVKIESGGLTGDDQNDKKHHGGPERAVCLFGLDVIEELRAEGHPIEPGSTGENLTIDGLVWSTVAPGDRFVFDSGVVLEIVSFAKPCSTIRESFAGGQIGLIEQGAFPGRSRVYARVITPGAVAVDEEFVHECM